ncbi:bacteriohemerythrin [Magnetospirillum sp. UT-4]|uniref:bacteriohemerythrin n=1 Tax=Magnetospirillum sp. UT-4 TaxID=2681467 RepID=UPI00137D52B9|nr:hemerythrin domain-containing protein [Magnetospirillum sp. UT-4]CAA7626677.1 putative Hemerythrin [Magnetospirillum sp. UT-4]
MAVIVWSDEFLIGHADLDQDHRALIAGINAIGLALDEARPNAEVIAEIDRWLAAFTIHIQAEEHMLQFLTLPPGRSHRVQHSKGHAEFVHRVQALRRAVADGTVAPGDMEQIGTFMTLLELIRADFEMLGHLRREGVLRPDGSLAVPA